MTNRELAELLLRYPDRTATVEVNGMLREVERVRMLDDARYLPGWDGSTLVEVGPVVVVEAVGP